MILSSTMAHFDSFYLESGGGFKKRAVCPLPFWEENNTA